MFYKYIYAMVVWQYVGAVPRVDSLVDTKVGLIRGQLATDGDYHMFLGIPYAKVDEVNPFGLSIPYAPFEDIFEANNDSAICPQISEFDSTRIVGSLDCLHLNIYVPNIASSTNRLPVLLWIHGGGFSVGFSGRYVFGPKFLVRHDVILVTVNYRLGPYGFMCLDNPAVPGNQGLKDQILAMKWVKDNIEAFGGDADRITAFGESAGAASINFHINLGQDELFNQAILQSGNILNPKTYKKASNDAALQLSNQLGFITNDVHEALSFISTVDSNLIIASSSALGLSFRPCVENNFDGVEPFLTDYPVNIQAKKFPLLIGFNNDECIFFYNRYTAEYFLENDFLYDNLNISFEFDDRTYDEMSEILKNFYFGDKPVNKETIREVLDFCLDFQYVHPTLRSHRKFFDSGTDSIFSYMFSYVGERNYFKYLGNITYGGVSHADDLSYFFDVSFVETVISNQDQIIIDRMTALWTNFAKYGNPTPETTELLPISWIPATRDTWNYLNIDSELTMESRPFKERMAFLDLFYKIYQKYQTGYSGH